MEIETQSYITNLLKTNPKIVENNLNYRVFAKIDF